MSAPLIRLFDQKSPPLSRGKSSRPDAHKCNEGIYLPSIRKALRAHFAVRAGKPKFADGPLPGPSVTVEQVTTVQTPTVVLTEAVRATAQVAAPLAPAATVISLMASPAKPIALSELTRRLADPRTPERSLAPYFRLDQDKSKPYAPQFALDWSLIEGGRPAESSHLAITGLDSYLVSRRRLLFRQRVAEGGTGILKLVADGDSWLEYPLQVDDLSDHLARDYAINFVAPDGAPNTLDSVTGAANLDRILGTIEETNAHALILSAGGSEVFGPALGGLVQAFSPRLAAHEYPTPALNQALAHVIERYRLLIDRTLAAYPGLRIFTHGYGLPPSLPNGPWLAAPLTAKGVADPAVQQAIVRFVLDRLNGEMERLARAYAGKVYVIDCRSALNDAGLWHDELNPNDDGFARVAALFRSAIESAFGRVAA